VSLIISDAALKGAFSSIAAYPSVALAVSGGPDSIALMHLACRWANVLGRSRSTLSVLTVDHGLRPEGKQEAAFVAEEAAKLGLTHATLTWGGVKPKTGIQAAARRARYALMAGHCRSHGLACLVTAHTEDDQAETFLMRLRRGSGLDGLAAMAPVSAYDGLPLIRPLLGISKARLFAYLRAGSLPFIRDPSNDNQAFERVRLRTAMKALALAGIQKPMLARAAFRLGRAREALDAAASAYLEESFTVRSLGQAETGPEAFFALPDEIALRVLAEALALIGGKDAPPQMAKVERLLKDLSRQREASLGGCLISLGRNSLRFYREPGRLGKKQTAAVAGATTVFDGRFLLNFADGMAKGLTLAPLGPVGWAHVRSVMKDQALTIKACRLAALTTPALWRGDALVAAPSLRFVEPGKEPGAGQPVSVELVPRLSRFLKPD